MTNSAAVFSLREVIDAIEGASDDTRWVANTLTGEVRSYYESWSIITEYEKGAFDGDEWLFLPDSEERNDWRTMRDFAYDLGGLAGDELLEAIHGSGAFHHFRRCVERMGALESWYAYKDDCICRLAIDWLEMNGLSWKDDRHENMKRDWRALLPEALRMRLELVVLDCALSVCKLENLPDGLMDGGFCCVARTEDELSVVCETARVPKDALASEDGLRALKVQGSLDFALVGILARISAALADADVPLFAISTYDTDYILVKEIDLNSAIIALQEEGCDILK